MSERVLLCFNKDSMFSPIIHWVEDLFTGFKNIFLLKSQKKKSFSWFYFSYPNVQICEVCFAEVLLWAEIASVSRNVFVCWRSSWFPVGLSRKSVPVLWRSATGCGIVLHFLSFPVLLKHTLLSHSFSDLSKPLLVWKRQSLQIPVFDFCSTGTMFTCWLFLLQCVFSLL